MDIAKLEINTLPIQSHICGPTPTNQNMEQVNHDSKLDDGNCNDYCNDVTVINDTLYRSKNSMKSMDESLNEAKNRCANGELYTGDICQRDLALNMPKLRQKDSNLIVIPSCYVIMFVNPKSGLRQGKTLLDLDISHFRIRTRPDVQISMFNINNEDDRNAGIIYLKILQLTRRIIVEQIHVWSAGGDGTFMWSIDEICAAGVEIDDPRLHFSLIPFGTGNDLSQVLGWGRTIPSTYMTSKMFLGFKKIIDNRVAGKKARLDIWEVHIKARDNGYIRRSSKNPNEEKLTELIRKMSNYSSIGVQGLVGLGFEPNRHSSRTGNIFEYTRQAAKLVLRGIPKVSEYASGLKYKDGYININDVPPKRKSIFGKEKPNGPVEFIISNIPGIWGRHVDIWNDAAMSKSPCHKDNASTDINNWTKNVAHDGKLEVFTIESTFSYFRKQLGNWGRRHLTRIGQFPDEIQFDLKENKKAALMIDGEFYELYNCESITYKRIFQVTMIGPSFERSRLVQDSQNYFKNSEGDSDIKGRSEVARKQNKGCWAKNWFGSSTDPNNSSTINNNNESKSVSSTN